MNRTPGPWFKSDRAEGAIAKAGDPLGVCFASTEGEIVWMKDSDYDLAVAAPILLAALESALAELNNYSWSPHPGGADGAQEFNLVRGAARSAIGIAKGDHP